GGEYRAFLGRPGQILYQCTESSPKIMSISEDGAGQLAVSDLHIMSLQSVSPDGRWALVGVTPPGGHGDKNSMSLAVPLGSGAPIRVCDSCSVAYGTSRASAPLLPRSMAARWV